ncbi:MAG: hypothetical protein ACI4VT_02125 [Bacilli bacterium]|nr:hypothetical protein [Bacilli bacterium]
MEKSSNLGLIILISGLLLLIVSIIINHNIDTSDTLNISIILMSLIIEVIGLIKIIKDTAK